jgi:hypothetical protein
MKATLIVVTAAAAVGLSTLAQAEELQEGAVMLSDDEMENVVAGADAPPGWSGDGFPGATNGNNPFGFLQPPGWGPEGFPGGPKGGPNQ